MTGRFISFEGGEGAGKTTLAYRIRDALKAEGYDVLFTREPGGTAFGEELRQVLLHRRTEEKISSKAELFLFLASRAQHIDELIKPALSRGAVVLCDRFSDSTIAYQGAGKELGLEYVAACCHLATDGFEPDLTFFVDLDPKQGLVRAGSRSSPDRMEKETLAFHQRVHFGFKELAKRFPKRIISLDGSLDPDALYHQASLHLKPLIKKEVS